MITEILKQVYDRGLEASVAEWFKSRLEKVSPGVTLGAAEHIIDWIEATKPVKLKKMRWDEALKAADKWTKSEQKKGSHIKEADKDTKLFMGVGEFEIVQLIGENAFKREGHLMSHCVASYYGKTGMKIYSLRDKDNNPHCTFEVVGDDRVQQVKGKGNGPIAPDYIEAVVQFLEKLGMEVRDSEMANLGYINIAKQKKYLNKETAASLFRKTYWNKKDKLLDKDRNEFACLELLDSIPLISEVGTELKVNFELPKFIKLSIEFLFSRSKKILGSETKAASGHSAKLAASGDSAQLAASGDSAQLAASGYYAKLELTGEHSVGAAIGVDNIIKGKLGTWITLAEYLSTYPRQIRFVKSAQIDGKIIKADTWYRLLNNEFTEIKST